MINLKILIILQKILFLFLKKNFYENYEIFHISAFEPNKVAGFIKSDISWHSVEKFNFEYDRRAKVINIYEWF